MWIKPGSVAQFLRLKSRDAARAIPKLNRFSVYKALGPLFCGFVIWAVLQVYSASEVAILPNLKGPISALLHSAAPYMIASATTPAMRIRHVGSRGGTGH